MKRSIESFLLRQLSNPLPEKFLELPKRATVLESITYEGRTYLGSNDWITVQLGGKPGKIRRSQLAEPAEVIEAPGSLIKGWREQRKVQLLHDQSYESSAWDVYSLPDGHRGYRPWDQPDQSELYTLEPENEFSNLWVPVRQRGKFFFLPWRMITGWPLVDESGGNGIDLRGALQKQHEQMVANAY